MKEIKITRKRLWDIVGNLDEADHEAIAEIEVISDNQSLVMKIKGQILGMNQGNKMVNYGFKRGMIGQLVGAHHLRPTQFMLAICHRGSKGSNCERHLRFLAR